MGEGLSPSNKVAAQLRKDHGDSGERTADQELNTGQADGIYFGYVMVNRSNLHGKAHRTKQQQQIGRDEGKIFVHAQKIQAKDGNDNANPDMPRTFFM